MYDVSYTDVAVLRGVKHTISQYRFHSEGRRTWGPPLTTHPAQTYEFIKHKLLRCTFIFSANIAFNKIHPIWCFLRVLNILLKHHFLFDYGGVWLMFDRKCRLSPLKLAEGEQRKIIQRVSCWNWLCHSCSFLSVLRGS